MISGQDLVRNFTLFVEKERVKAGLTQAEMAAKLDMSLSGYKKMVGGETSRINLQMAVQMHNMTGKWLFEMLQMEDTDLYHTAKTLRRLSSSQLRFIRNIVDFEAAFTLGEKRCEDYISVLVPTGEMMDGMIYDSCQVVKVEAAAYRKLFGDDLNSGIQITSIHFQPVYNPGDILLLSKNPIRDGDTGVFLNREDGRLYIRKFRQGTPCILEPITYYGTPCVMDTGSSADTAKWVRLGRVLTKMRNEVKQMSAVKNVEDLHTI